MTRGLLTLLAIVGGGCGGAADGYPDMDTPLPEAPARAKPAQPAKPTERPDGTLFRDEVDAVVDAGLGEFLRHVEVEPSLEQGSFRGFRIVALYPPEFWQGVDLNPGDVVVRINGMPIERPPEAFKAFQSLKTEDRLVVDLERAGQRRRLSYPIVSRDRRAASSRARATPDSEAGGPKSSKPGPSEPQPSKPQPSNASDHEAE